MHEKLIMIRNRLALLTETCTACISVDGQALEGLAEALMTAKMEIETLMEALGYDEEKNRD